MNYGISVLFRTIPLLMALFCFGYGAFVLDMGTDPAKNVAGPVVMSLGMICIALFATAATIIRQIIHTYNTVVLYALPVLGYLTALLTFICGWEYISAVSYTHLRAHETGRNLVCRLLLEKKKTNKKESKKKRTKRNKKKTKHRTI